MDNVKVVSKNLLLEDRISITIPIKSVVLVLFVLCVALCVAFLCFILFVVLLLFNGSCLALLG